MKRYVLFAYDAYYPGGGMNDFASAHDTIEDAEAAGQKQRTDYFDVADLESHKVVSEWVAEYQASAGGMPYTSKPRIWRRLDK